MNRDMLSQARVCSIASMHSPAKAALDKWPLLSCETSFLSVSVSACLLGSFPCSVQRRTSEPWKLEVGAVSQVFDVLVVSPVLWSLG